MKILIFHIFLVNLKIILQKYSTNRCLFKLRLKHKWGGGHSCKSQTSLGKKKGKNSVYVPTPKSTANVKCILLQMKSQPTFTLHWRKCMHHRALYDYNIEQSEMPPRPTIITPCEAKAVLQTSLWFIYSVFLSFPPKHLKCFHAWKYKR